MVYISSWNSFQFIHHFITFYDNIGDGPVVIIESGEKWEVKIVHGYVNVNLLSVSQHDGLFSVCDETKSMNKILCSSKCAAQ